MTMPKGNKLHIGVFGGVNTGKSTLFNSLAGECIAIVSDEKGTTTDAVYKATELGSLGAVILVDTAGFNDETELGKDRIKATKSVLDNVDIAILIMSDNTNIDYDSEWLQYFSAKDLPYVMVSNNHDESYSVTDSDIKNKIITVNAKTTAGIDTLIAKLESMKPERDHSLLRGLVKEGDLVVLVMPQDDGAPNSRLILPQAMTVRELVDKHAVSINCDMSTLAQVVHKYGDSIDLIITDSSVFSEVERVAKGKRLTSFSVLYAGLKGDITELIAGSNAMDSLNSDSKVLILEACSHVTTHEDIGRVKIPRLIRQKHGEEIVIDFVRSAGQVPDMQDYDLVIHCGGCMITARSMMARMNKACEIGVPMTNYGIAIAKLTGVLDKIIY